MIIIPLPITWIAVAAVALLIAHVLGWRLTRPLPRRHSRAIANRIADAHTEPVHLVRGTAAELQVEGMHGRWRRRCARAARLEAVAASRREAIVGLGARRDDLASRSEALRGESIADGEPEPFFTTRATAISNAALYAGDLFVVANAMVAIDAAMSPLQALVTSLAIATALFVAGKVAGDRLRELEHRSLRFGTGMVVFTAAIGLIAGALFLLRIGRVEAWIGLAIAPALGAGGVTLLAPSRLQKAAHALERRARRTDARMGRSEIRLARLAGRRDHLSTLTALELVRSGLHAEAQALLVGLPNAATNLSAAARRVGVSLGERFDPAEGLAGDELIGGTSDRRLIVVGSRTAHRASSNGERRG